MINERSAHEYCRDDISKIENYDKAIADTTQTWHLHHRMEFTLDGEFALTSEQLKMHDMYYHRPYYELIFLTPTEHMILHMKDKCLHEDTKQRISESLKGIKRGPMSEEHRRKLSESKKGKSAWNKGKRGIYSEETRRKMGEANKDKKGHHHSEETRRKLSEAAKNRAKITEDTRRKQSESHKGLRWKLIDGNRVYYRNEEDASLS